VPRSPAARLELGSLYVVADGMSGHPAGDRASQLAVSTLVQEYYAPGDLDPAPRLVYSVKAANARIHQEGERDPVRRGMGTTIACALIRGWQLVVAHVGDSRVYLVRGGTATPLTRDHTWVAEAVARGVLSADQAASHPQAHRLGRSLGSHSTIEVDTAQCELAAGDRLLLCTNGLPAVVDDATLAVTVGRQQPATAAQALVETANARGGPGNIAVIVVAVEPEPAGEAASSVGTLLMA
jgi:protein phosphatase